MREEGWLRSSIGPRGAAEASGYYFRKVCGGFASAPMSVASEEAYL
jgi:hypothetical protein